MKELPSEEEFDKLSIIEKLAAILNITVMIRKIESNSLFQKEEEEEERYQSNFDTTKQEVGDVVKVVSMLGTGYLWDEKHLQNRTPNKEERLALLERTAIVVEIDCEKRLKCNHCEHLHPVDTLIYFSDTKEKFYTMNNFLTSI